MRKGTKNTKEYLTPRQLSIYGANKHILFTASATCMFSFVTAPYGRRGHAAERTASPLKQQASNNRVSRL